MQKLIKKIPGHTQQHFLLAIILAVIAISLAITIKSYVEASDTLTTTVATTCTYETGDWSKCDSTGRQTRTVTKVPSGCITSSTTTVPASTQSCTYVSTTPCTYTYSDWNDCSSSGYQTRTVKSKTPTGCVESNNLELKRTCTYTPTVVPVACTYTYSSWNACDSSGYQTRTIASKSPSGCTDSATAILKQSCTYADSSDNDNTSTIACAYNLSDWSTCDSLGKQTRTIISKTPTGCYESDKPSLENRCDYTTTSSQTDETRTASTTKSTSLNPSFNFLNLNGGEVISGEISIQGTVSKATSVEFYLIPIESNIPKYLGQAKNTKETVWEYTLDSTKQPNGSFNLQAKIKNIYGSYESDQRSLIILNPLAETESSSENSQSNSDSEENTTSTEQAISADWQKQYFKQDTCVDEKICGGLSDPDNDGLNNNEEYRLGTNPTKSDSDQDGFLDGDEIRTGFNPLKASPGDKSDKLVFESPKETGEVKKEFYKIEQVEMVAGENDKKNLKINGKALPNTYVTIYIYSDPIILTVKADADGNWSYTLDKDIEDGEHEVYVAVTDNTGKITAKSEPIAFVKSAEAATIIPPAEASATERAISPTEAWSKRDSSLFLVISIAGLALALAILGLVKHELLKKPETNTPS